MSKAAYIGVDGVARKAKRIYVGVDGVARKVKKGYVGVNGVARLFYSSGSGIFVTRPAAAMTSNNSQGCVVSTSSEYSNNVYGAWRAFDKKNEDQYGWAAKTGVSAAWIQIKMDIALENITVTIANRVFAYTNGPETGIIQGSNDGEIWVDLCSFEGRDGETSAHSTTHECNNSTPYQYVRIDASRTKDLLAIGEITIVGELPESE